LQAVFIEAVTQGASGEAEELGGPNLITSGQAESLLDEVFIEVVEDYAFGGQLEGRCVAPVGVFGRSGGCQGYIQESEVIEAEGVVVFEEGDPLDGIAEFLYVSLPRMVEHTALRFRLQFTHRVGRSCREFLQKSLNEGYDVLATLPERGDVDRGDVESIEQVFSEFALFGGFAQVAVRGRHDTDVDGDAFVAAESVERSFLQDPQELDLVFGIEFPDFVEKKRASICGLELADPRLGGSGEGALLATEQL